MHTEGECRFGGGQHRRRRSRAEEAAARNTILSDFLSFDFLAHPAFLSRCRKQKAAVTRLITWQSSGIAYWGHPSLGAICSPPAQAARIGMLSSFVPTAAEVEKPLSPEGFRALRGAAPAPWTGG